MPPPSRRSTGTRVVLLAVVVGAAIAAAAVAASQASSARPGATVGAAPVFAPLRSAVTSSNWAGYALTGTGTSGEPTAFTNVTGTWTVPRPDCTASGQSDSAFWIGLGGYSGQSQALEQVGSESTCTAAGTPRYSLWYELVPAPSLTVPLKAAAGDTITGAVLVTGTSAGGANLILQLTNRTRHTRYTKRVFVPTADLSSAEWIAEAPSLCSPSGLCWTLPLAHFGSVTFGRAAATGDGHPGTLSDPVWTAIPITLAENGLGGLDPRFVQLPETSTTGAVPGPLTPDGRGFTVTWQPAVTP